MTTESAEPQNHDSLWTCSKEELQAELDNYVGEFGVEKWTAKHAAHFLELRFHLVRDTVTKVHIDEILRITKSEDLDTREYRMVTVLAVLENEFIFKTPDDIETLYLYRNGIYVEADTVIKARIEELLQDKANSHFCYEVIEHFKRRSYVPRSDFNHFVGLIPVQNGLLNLNTMKLDENDPDKIFTYRIATGFDANADCPLFKAFFSQVLPDPDEQRLLQEFAGYTLLPAFPHQYFMVLVGSGRNGKGAFIRTVEGVLGPDCTTSIPLEYFDGQHRFQLANLYGSLMNWCSEPGMKKGFSTETLKRITGGDTIDAEKKNKQKLLKFRSFAKFFILANQLPKIRDTTLSFWDRVLILEFKQSFTDDKGNRVPDIENAWLNNEQERSGILNWMIAGLARLMESGKFTRIKSHDEMVLTFKQVSDPIDAFLSDRSQVTYEPSLFVTRDDLYNRYKQYVDDLGLEAEAQKRFAEEVRKRAGISDKKKRLRGANERVWMGIELVQEGATSQRGPLDVLTDDRGTGALGAGVSLHDVLGDTREEKTEGCAARAPSAPRAPADFNLPESREERWKDLLARAKGRDHLTLADMDTLYTGTERSVIDRELGQWEREGRVCWVIDERDRSHSHWKVMEGEM